MLSLNMHEMEKSLLGAMLRDVDVCKQAVDAGVTTTTFTSIENGKIFNAMSKRLEMGQPIDLVLIGSDLPELAVYAAEAFNSIATTVNAPQWIKELRQCEARRIVRDCLSRTAQKLVDGDISLGAAANIVDECFTATTTIGNDKIRSLEEIGADFEAVYLQKQPPATIPFFPADTIVGKELILRPGQVLVIAAGSGAGKTQLAAQAAIEQLKAGLSVLYVCTETSDTDIFARLLAPEVGRNHFTLLYDGRSPRTVAAFTEQNKEFRRNYGNRLFIAGVNSGSMNIRTMRAMMREAAKKAGKVDVVIVDFLQDLEPLDARASANDNLSRAMTIISHTAKEYNAAAIVLSQINRTGQNSDAEPSLSWLKDCSKIGELANTVCFLVRQGDRDSARIVCVKSRDCGSFEEPLTYSDAKYISEPYIDARCAPETQIEY